MLYDVGIVKRRRPLVGIGDVPFVYAPPAVGGWAGPTSGLTHRWPLNSTSVLDQVGSINGTFGAGCSLVTGPSGAANAATLFSQLAAAILLASDPMAGGGGPFSIGFWLYANTFLVGDGDARPFCMGSTAQTVVWATGNDAAATNQIAVDILNSVYGWGIGGLSIHTWYHLLFTFDGSSTTGGYLNGSAFGNSTTQGDAADAGVYGIGERNDSGNTRYFGGAMAQVVVYNKVLSAGEATTLYNAF